MRIKPSTILQDQSGSSMVYVILLAGLVMAGANYFMQKNQNLSQELSKVGDRAEFAEVHEVLKHRLYDSMACASHLKGQVIEDLVGAEEKGAEIKNFQFDKFSGTLTSGGRVNSVKIKDIVIETKKLLRSVSQYEPERNFKAYEVDLFIEPDGLSDLYSLKSVDYFKTRYAIPLTVYVDPVSMKIESCFGSGSPGDVCTKMGGAYSLSGSAPLNCQPDTRCISHKNGLQSTATCPDPDYFKPSLVGSYGSAKKYMCMWCPRGPAGASPGGGGGTPGGGGSPGGGGGGGGCFVAGTSISMGDGSLKAIESVKPGDIVMTPEHGPAKVLNAMIKNFKGYVYSINGSPYFMTSNHPIKTVEGWKAFNPELAKLENPDLEIAQLGLGDVILTEKGAEMLIKYDGRYREEKVYNINVDGPSEYIAGGYAVHNKEKVKAISY